MPGSVLCRFPEGKSDFAKQNRPVLGAFLLSWLGRAWLEVVEKYISGQKGHDKIDTVPVIAEEKEKLRAHKTWYISLYDKLFGGNHQK
jgi:hypothetical protein